MPSPPSSSRSTTPSASADAAALAGLLCARIGLPRREIADPRIAAAVRAIEAAPADFPTIAPAAAIAGLSVPRFRHLFRDSLGTPFRRYRLWTRMAVVARALSRGQTLTGAALDAGFSSSAHLGSAFRRMFGIRPSDLLARGARFSVDRPAGRPRDRPAPGRRGYSAASSPAVPMKPPDWRFQ